jgi:hypothetical protein
LASRIEDYRARCGRFIGKINLRKQEFDQDKNNSLWGGAVGKCLMAGLVEMEFEGVAERTDCDPRERVELKYCGCGEWWEIVKSEISKQLAWPLEATVFQQSPTVRLRLTRAGAVVDGNVQAQSEALYRAGITPIAPYLNRLTKNSSGRKNTGAKVSKSNGSPAPGEATDRIIAGLIAWHKYSNGSVTNFEPIILNAAAAEWGVSSGSLSLFLKDKFGSYAAYKATCRDTTK